MPFTLKDYERGRIPRCAKCGCELDPEEDAYHDGYRGSPHAHGGAGSYGLAAHHYVFSPWCSACLDSCERCAREAEWSALPELERALARFADDDVGGMLMRVEHTTGAYWLFESDAESAALHRPAEFYAWDEGRGSRQGYVELCEAIRRQFGKDADLPAYIALHKQPDYSKASALYENMLTERPN